MPTSASDLNDKMLSQALKADTQSRDVYPTLNYFRTDDLSSNLFFLNLGHHHLYFLTLYPYFR